MAIQKKTVEGVLLMLAAVVTLGIVVASQYFERQLTNQKLMVYQLQAIRTSINLFKAMTHRNPNSLLEMAEAEYSFAGETEKRHYIDVLDINDKGEVIDPFGHPYFYSVTAGWVKSSTAGYEYW